MSSHLGLRVFTILFLSSFLGSQSLFAKKEEWKDIQGNSFMAEPSQILGPFAIFRTGPLHGRRVMLDQLDEPTCARLASELQARPGRSMVWAAAKSELSGEFLKAVSRVGDKGFVPADLKSAPEPEIFVVVHASAGNGDAWRMLGKASGALRALMNDYPGFVDGIFVGYGHNAAAQWDMPKAMGWPGLVMEHSVQPVNSSLYDFFQPGTPAVLVLTRDGIPLATSESDSDKDIERMLTITRELVKLSTRLDNPQTWPARARYARAARPLIYRDSDAPPLLMGNPLRTDGLSQRGVRLIDAQLDIAADGRILELKFEDDSLVPEGMRGPLSEALKKACVFVPAISRGKPVAGSYNLRMDLPNASGKTGLADLVS